MLQTGEVIVYFTMGDTSILMLGLKLQILRLLLWGHSYN